MRLSGGIVVLVEGCMLDEQKVFIAGIVQYAIRNGLVI